MPHHPPRPAAGLEPRAGRSGRVGPAAVLVLAALLSGASAGTARGMHRQAGELRLRRLERKGGGYDGFEARQQVERFGLALVHSSGETCDLLVTFASRGGAGRRSLQGPGRGLLAYELLGDANGRHVLENDPDAPARGALATRLASPGDKAALDYFVRIPAGQIVAAGVYGDVLELTLYEIEGGGGRRPLDRASVALSASVRPQAEVSIAGTDHASAGGRTYKVVDFGTLRAGDRRAVFLEVRSSAGYELTFSSDNGGVLRHESPSGDWWVGYAARLDGRLLPLASSATVHGQGPTPLRGASHQLEFEIGAVEGKMAGNYLDTLRIEVRPVE